MKNTTAMIRYSSMIIAALALSGCGLLRSQGNAALTVRSATYLNPDINGSPSPVVVNVYELKRPFAFKQASFYKLYSNAAAVLGNDLIDKQTFEVRPGRSLNISQPLSKNTKYLGIVAAYRNIDQAKWQSLVKVNPNKSTDITISLESQGLIANVS